MKAFSQESISKYKVLDQNVQRIAWRKGLPSVGASTLIRIHFGHMDIKFIHGMKVAYNLPYQSEYSSYFLSNEEVVLCMGKMVKDSEILAHLIDVILGEIS